MALLSKLLHNLRLSTIIASPIPGSSLRVASDGLTDMQVVAADWRDLSFVQSWLGERRCGGVYLLVGRRGGRVRIRVGEGVKLWLRLGDHRADAQLDFVDEIYVLTSARFHKASVVYLQEMLTEIVVNAPELDCHKGCGPLAGFPLGEEERKCLDFALLLGLGLVNAAGLRVLSPEQSGLARRVSTLLAEAA